ncbi:Xaa-Pro peptidase family protein [Pseudooceanicola sp. HF7]|uniref:M24 family metallopeptidase n=1 Tax=Pseudooceanicola sp. HF7 TaxID=2721560 RepID=UPI001430BC40|nr:Xaa-Pro peptidase family protein [Pseudooceanicola sp. HF7]NIZ08082.1 aminopeptidase P family protein [Pseudooceanicola sp. HF7]
MSYLMQAEERLSRLRARMAETETDLVVLGPSSHMAWLTGLNPHGDERPVMLLVSADHAGFLMPSLNAAMAKEVTSLPLFTWVDDTGPRAALDALLDASNARRPGLSVVIDETMRADFALLLLDSLDSPRRRFTDDTVGLLRTMKDEGEAARIKAAHLLNDAAVEAAFAALKPGMTEAQVVELIEAHYKANGATAAFCSVCFGANGAFPHHHPGITALGDNMAVLIDTGCVLDGYPSDMTRCRWFGPDPDPEFLKVRDLVEAAVQAALAAAKPGAPASAVDAAARDVITEGGYGDRFLHRTGHGLGIDIHEPPYITGTSETPLAKGNVFSIEPGIYLEGKFGLRLEEIVILREDGPEIFSEMPRV